ncbi:hypothetical protein ACFQY0_00045 [Haloferula chungangensis]|uniref:Tetratricopeptide repeat protein n=1 Tax=Haloferula chungangensis TaxID=1048331 RepID=A0ABW2L2G9_9BACT
MKRLLVLSAFLIFLMPAPVSSQNPPDGDESSAPDILPELQTEIAETKVSSELCESYASYADEHPGARSTLASLRTIFYSQLSKGNQPLSIRNLPAEPNTAPKPPNRQSTPSAIPSIYAGEDLIAALPDVLRTGFDARKAAYIELARATLSIPELSPVSICALYEMGELGEPAAFELFLEKLAPLLTANYPHFQSSIAVDQNRGSGLEAATLAVQLATKLERSDELRAILKPAPPEAYAGVQLAQRLLALTDLYTHDSSPQGMTKAADLVAGRRISFDDLVTAATFRKQAYETTVGVLVAALKHENSAYLQAAQALQILGMMPEGKQTTADQFLRSYLDSKQTHQRQQQEIAGLIIENGNLSARFKSFEPELLGLLLSPSGESSSLVGIRHLEQVAAYLGRRAGEGGIDDEWRKLATLLATQFLRYPEDRGPTIREAMAKRLLDIGLSLDDPELLEAIVTRMANSVTWPFELVFRCLRNDRKGAALAALNHGKSDNLFPLYPHQLQPEDLKHLIPLAEELLGENDTPSQENVFIAMQLIESCLRNKPTEATLERANELYEQIVRRWGEVESTNENLLQQGNRVLWRNSSIDKEAAVPALRTWLELHPVSQIITRKENGQPSSDAEHEVWRACLNSGYFQPEIAQLADALTEAGASGDAIRHQKITEALVRAIASGSSSKGHPKPLSSYYAFVKNWFLTHTDFSLQEQAPAWSGILAECRGLGLKEDDIGKVLQSVLSYLKRTNAEEQGEQVTRLDLYLKLSSLELSDEVEFQIVSYGWGFGYWSVLELGTPQEAFELLDKQLDKHPNREFWASYFLSYAQSSFYRDSEGQRLERSEGEKAVRQWHQDFRSSAAGTWLEPVATALAAQPDKAQALALYSLASPTGRQQLESLPLGLRQKLLLNDKLDDVLTEHPTQAEPILRMAADSIIEALSLAPLEAPDQQFSYLGRTGSFPSALLAHYRNNPPFYREIYRDLKKALAAVFEIHATRKHDKPDNVFNSLSTLLLQIETIDNDLEIGVPEDLAPSIPLITYLKAGETEKALALLTDSNREFGFRFPPNPPVSHGPTAEDDERLFKDSAASVMEKLPTSLADRRIYLRLLVSDPPPINRRILAMNPIARSENRPDDEFIAVLSEFDQHEFSDDELRDACLSYLSQRYDVGRHLPHKLEAWKKRVSGEPERKILSTPLFDSWFSLQVEAGNIAEVEKVIQASQAKTSDGRSLHVPRERWATIRIILQDALDRSSEANRSARETMVSAFLALQSPRTPTGWRHSDPTGEQQLLYGSLLGHALAASENEEEIRALEEKITMNDPDIRDAGFRASCIDHALYSASRTSREKSSDLRLDLFERIMAFQSKLVMRSVSLAPSSTAFMTGLIDASQAREWSEAALEKDPEKMTIRFDHAMLLDALGEQEAALEHFKQISDSPMPTDNLVEQRAFSYASYKARHINSPLR